MGKEQGKKEPELSANMIDFLRDQEVKSEIQAYIDAANELGVGLSKEDAIRAVELEMQKPDE
ncbi:hypothetical protein A3B45_03835 [Candidatus Daviesbacteria bacterium RIFCSPLOWO2_01_FULL_39_12]|uniref:Uncharacterized protein n=1 Tax=Candidatus Daviesbacteria bacterium RIFCSPLOWO2_01_FULL_39_12 TaxID=1797785 RepID=A0A1F5KTW9_9BACT|nr:MAG: hypothetical protein A3D79_03280 [Candidatus Daviesbacteria bacterium RIFCSPHIGHO2_02_FULL_39_8]OGE44378.1 MAG: hypothetical protein A3B45_03835 [Candidatus Daviesbacteria bacterium RIFCSPLOWO2_01_FULL_39_12]